MQLLSADLAAPLADAVAAFETAEITPGRRAR
jgi:hypothetical protein